MSAGLPFFVAIRKIDLRMRFNPRINLAGSGSQLVLLWSRIVESRLWILRVGVVSDNGAYQKNPHGDERSRIVCHGAWFSCLSSLPRSF